MTNHYGTCTLCKEFFNGEHQYICNKCMEKEKIKMTVLYKCMVCGKEYHANNIPTKGHVDGCCTAGSLIEIKYIPMKEWGEL